LSTNSYEILGVECLTSKKPMLVLIRITIRIWEFLTDFFATAGIVRDQLP